MATASAQSPEVWYQADKLRTENEALVLKNKTLQEEVHRMRSVGVVMSESEDDEVMTVRKKKKYSNIRRSKCLKIVLVAVPVMSLVGVCLFIIGFYAGDRREYFSNTSGQNGAGLITPLALKRPLSSKLSGAQNLGEQVYNKHYLNIGERRDFLLQECQGPELKRSFPDLDYALMGYNILKAFPLAVGHDPGFSLPIFAADYSDSGQTADCRYSVPRGLVVTADVSCVVSFTSKVIQTSYEFSKSLAASAQVSGGGWGVSFSASAGYKQASSSVSTGEYAYILSTASCRYYYSNILANLPPPFHPAFLDWIHRLDAAPDNAVDLFADFFDKYGTHFAPQVIFGARYTYEYKMESKKLKETSESGVNVAVAASYSGLFSAGGGFNLDTSQKEAASNFQKNVETKTITIGAPPPERGDAQKWASTVKEDPVPVEYKLASIEELFSYDYMHGLGVNYTRIANNIKVMKGKYCKYLMDKGEVDSCQELQPGLELDNTRLYAHYRHISADKTTCIEGCMSEVKCVAITKCTSCTDPYQKRKNLCYLYEERQMTALDLNGLGLFQLLPSKGKFSSSQKEEGWESLVFLPKIPHQFYLFNTVLEGIERGRSDNDKVRADSYKECWSWCFQDEQCVAFSYCDCTSRASNCHLYAEKSIVGMKAETGTPRGGHSSISLDGYVPPTRVSFS